MTSWYERDFSEAFGTELQMVYEVVQRRRCDVIDALEGARERKYVLDEARGRWRWLWISCYNEIRSIYELIHIMIHMYI